MEPIKCSDRVDFDPGDQIDKNRDQKFGKTRDFRDLDLKMKNKDSKERSPVESPFLLLDKSSGADTNGSP